MSSLLRIHFGEGFDLSSPAATAKAAHFLTLATHERGEWCDADKADEFGRRYSPADVLCELMDHAEGPALSAAHVGAQAGLQYLLEMRKALARHPNG